MIESPMYRIIQWANGNMGHHALRMILERPDFELVSLRVYDPAKRGRGVNSMVSEQQSPRVIDGGVR